MRATTLTRTDTLATPVTVVPAAFVTGRYGYPTAFVAHPNCRQLAVVWEGTGHRDGLYGVTMDGIREGVAEWFPTMSQAVDFAAAEVTFHALGGRVHVFDTVEAAQTAFRPLHHYKVGPSSRTLSGFGDGDVVVVPSEGVAAVAWGPLLLAVTAPESAGLDTVADQFETWATLNAGRYAASADLAARTFAALTS